MYDLVLLGTVVLVGACWLDVLLWWHRARTTWLSRLSARGVVSGRYTPYRGTAWGSIRSLLDQRIAVGDFSKIADLEPKADSDRATELWRVRTERRFRIALATAPLVLLVPFLVAALLDQFGGVVMLVVVASVFAVAIPARNLFRRARAYGDAADTIA